MDVVGSEIGQKMRSAIKAKLTELGCYVDDELPDYVMVMVANKRTRSQMEEDLQLFLGENTVLFVNWLHQVLKKLQEVSVTTPPTKPPEPEIIKPKATSVSKEKKPKEKKDKEKHKHSKSDSRKKTKKKLKEKHKKKGDKKNKEHKSKKKNKDSEIKRPNVPPLLMNLEKVSEPSITDIFAGQILKNHGVTIEEPKAPSNQDVDDKKPSLLELNQHEPIIDLNTITSSVDDDSQNSEVRSEGKAKANTSQDVPDVESKEMAKPSGEEELKQIESKIEGLRQKLAVQLETMSDDEDFLNIRTEADELMNDFAEDVIQEISSANPVSLEPPPAAAVSPLPETLPQIELNLPKRAARDRLGSREPHKDRKEKRKRKRDSDERFTPEKTPEFWPQSKSAKSRLGDPPETATQDHDSDKNGMTKSSSRVSPSLASAPNATNAPPASVVRVRPRPRPASNGPASNLLKRAMADAHKSLINIPPKQDPTEQKIKRALVLPMRRGEPQRILVQIPTDKVQSHNSGEESECELELETDSLADLESDSEKKDAKDTEYVPLSITRKINNTNYTPSRRDIDIAAVDETIVVQTINNSAPVKEKGPTFVVTLDGLDPNIFLAKKLKTEGLLDEEEALTRQIRPLRKPVEKKTEIVENNDKTTPKVKITFEKDKKRLSDTSEESDTQVIIENAQEKSEKRKSEAVEEVVEVKKRKASPIVFEVVKEQSKERERTESASSDKSVIISTSASSNKFDSVPSLPSERKPLPCRAFPLCRFGASCAFTHPPCKFSTACSRRNCIYSHPQVAHKSVGIASHVVPAANFKSISSAPLIPNLCKFYPNCVNINCHFYHPKACRYGTACVNKTECNFYHHELAASKWKAA